MRPKGGGLGNHLTIMPCTHLSSTFNTFDDHKRQPGCRYSDSEATAGRHHLDAWEQRAKEIESQRDRGDRERHRQRDKETETRRQRDERQTKG